MRSPLLVTASALLLAACQRATSPSPAAPAASAASNQVAAGNVAAGNSVVTAVPVLQLTGTSAVALGQAVTPLTTATETTIDPGAGFRVELPVALGDARLSLLDAGDAMVPSTGSREVGQATLLALKPSAALPRGAHLRLRVDGAATRELHGADGRRFAPLEWPVMVSGDAEPRPGSARKGKR